jgi:hypothetical protein
MVPIDFQAACLYCEPFAKIDFDHFISTITAIVADDGLDIDITHRTDDVALFLKVGACCIKIELMRNPCAPEGFQNALVSPYLSLQSFDFAGMVHDNQQHILLTVVSGDGIFNGEHMAMIANMGIDMNLGENETQEQMELRLKLLHMATLYICTYAKPDVIHWTQSEQMYTGDTYLSFVDEELPLLLLLHPWIKQGETEAEVTVRYLGAEQMIGTCLILKSTALDLLSVVEIGSIFVEYCRMINAIPEHGNTAGREEEWIVQVHREPASNAAPMGITYLTLQSHKDMKSPPTPSRPPIASPRVQAPVVNRSEQDLRDAFLNKSKSNSIFGKLNPFRKG